MTKKDLISDLKSKRVNLSEEEAAYLDEEIKGIKIQSDDVKKILKIIESGEKMENNKDNILSYYLLGIAPYPSKLQHHWELSDMCDIDLDFSPNGRDKIKDWLREKFGENNCVSIGTYGTLGVKGSVQEISRVYGISPFKYLAVSKLMSDDDKDLSELEIREKYPDVDEFLNQHPEVAKSLTKLTGMKKNIGQHAGGFVVSSDNLTDVIPIVRSNKGYVTGWQESGHLKELEALGVIKVDILGLSAVEQIGLCVSEINRKYPDNDLPKDIYLLEQDPKVYEFMNTLQLDNIFQMESKIFVEAIRAIKPKNIDDISNISTMIRPGANCTPQEYRSANFEDQKHPSCISEVYRRTRGFMLFQEQMMQIPMQLADFSIFEADKLRRLIRKIGKAKTTDENRSSMLEECTKYQNMYMDVAVPKIIREDGWKINEATEYADKQWQNMMLQAKYLFNLPHCFFEDEIFTLSNNKKKRAKYLKNGDKIIGYSNNKIEEVEIVQNHDNGIQEVYEITTNKNIKIKCTLNHKFATKNGLKTVKEIFSENLEILEISDLRK